MLGCRAHAILALMKEPECLERERAELAARRPHAHGSSMGQPTGFGSGSSPAPQSGGGPGSERRAHEHGVWGDRSEATGPQQIPDPRC